LRIGALALRPFQLAFDLSWGLVEKFYPRILAASLSHPLIVVLAASVLTWAAVRRIDSLGVELLPEIHQGEFTAHVALGVGTPLEHSDRIYSELEREVRALDGVAVTALVVGVEQDTLTRDIEGEHTARLTLRLEPAAASPAGEADAIGRVRSLLEAHPEVRSIEFSRPTPFALDEAIAVEILGHDLELLSAIGAEVARRLESIEGIRDVRTSVRSGHPEALVTFDRDKTLEYQLDLDTVSNLLRDQVLGTVSTRFVEGEERIDIRVRGDEQLLASLEDVLDLAVNPTAETPVPLRSVADVVIVRGPAEIRRIGNERAVVVTASSAGLDLGGIGERIQKGLGSLVTPTDVSIELGGQKREMDKGLSSLRFALLLAIFLVYVVMASQFESLLQPLVILFTLPLAAVGVVFALDLLSIPLSVVVFIGLILLAGVVVNNAIVLMDRINQNRAGGMELRAALLEAGTVRLRPIMMTAACTVLGLLPMTGWFEPIAAWLEGMTGLEGLGAGAAAELRAPMAITVIAGMTSSTLLTLVVIPVLYSMVSGRLARSAPAATSSTEQA
jgi:HAE1 family hydrophobic/amphiphilic exporter-1